MNSRKKTKRRKSRSMKGLSAGSVLKQPKFIIPVVIIVGILFVYSGGFVSMSAFRGDGWAFEVKYSSIEVGSYKPPPNGVKVSTNLDGIKVDGDYGVESVVGGISILPENTGYSPTHIGTGTWRSIYLVDGVEYITSVGDDGLPYSEAFAGGEVVRTYQLLMQVLIMTVLEYDIVSPASTLTLDVGIVSSTEIPAIREQAIAIEFSAVTTWFDESFEGSISLLDVEKSGEVDGIVKSQTTTGGIVQIPISGYAEVYGDEPYISPVFPVMTDIELSSGEDVFELRFIVAPGVASHNSEWLARNVELTFDLKFTVEVIADEFSAARVALPDWFASPIGGFNLFESWLPALGIEQIIIVGVVIVLILFTVIYWKMRGRIAVWGAKRSRGQASRGASQYEASVKYGERAATSKSYMDKLDRAMRGEE